MENILWNKTRTQILWKTGAFLQLRQLRYCTELNMTSGFPCEVDDNCAILGYYAASSGNSLPTFRGQPIGLIFRREVDDNCALLGYYAVHNGNSWPTFWDNQSVPSSRVKNPETSVRNCHYLLRNNPRAQFSWYRIKDMNVHEYNFTWGQKYSSTHS